MGLLQTLKDYCERKRADGFDHPFLWETIADFTTDDKIAIDLYLHALEVKCDDNAPYLASISLALAKRYCAVGNKYEALRFGTEANDVAKKLDDLDLRREISEFLLAVNTDL